MFHGDNPQGLFWFPYSLHHQKVADIIKRTLLKWAMANNNMEFPIVRQACFCLFVCLYMWQACLFICLFDCKNGLQQIDNWSDSIIEQLVLFHRDMFNIEADKEEVGWCLFHIWNDLLSQYSSINSGSWLFALHQFCHNKDLWYFRGGFDMDSILNWCSSGWGPWSCLGGSGWEAVEGISKREVGLEYRDQSSWSTLL